VQEQAVEFEDDVVFHVPNGNIHWSCVCVCGMCVCVLCGVCDVLCLCVHMRTWEVCLCVHMRACEVCCVCVCVRTRAHACVMDPLALALLLCCMLTFWLVDCKSLVHSMMPQRMRVMRQLLCSYKYSWHTCPYACHYFSNALCLSSILSVCRVYGTELH
jgi:hypothetical protein